MDLSSSAAAATAGTAGVQCPANTYCPAASTAPTPCPAKTASSAGSAAASDCSAVAGYYVAPPGASGLRLRRGRKASSPPPEAPSPPSAPHLSPSGNHTSTHLARPHYRNQRLHRPRASWRSGDSDPADGALPPPSAGRDLLSRRRHPGRPVPSQLLLPGRRHRPDPVPREHGRSARSRRRHGLRRRGGLLRRPARLPPPSRGAGCGVAARASPDCSN